MRIFQFTVNSNLHFFFVRLAQQAIYVHKIKAWASFVQVKQCNFLLFFFSFLLLFFLCILKYNKYQRANYAGRKKSGWFKTCGDETNWMKKLRMERRHKQQMCKMIGSDKGTILLKRINAKWKRRRKKTKILLREKKNCVQQQTCAKRI